MVNTKKYRTMIVEDDPMAARHLEMVLDKMEEIFISYVIENALMAEAYCCREHIDLILMDVCTAMNASGLEAAVKIKKNFPAVKILILTSQLDPELLRRAREEKSRDSATNFLMTARLLRQFAQFLTEKMFIRMKYQLLRLGMHGAQRLTGSI